jgi:HK97 gp10 family phage protein
MPNSGFEFDDRAFLFSLARAGELIESEATRMQERVADAIVTDAQQAAPVDTGRLRASIHRTPSQRHLGEAEIEVRADAPYAAYVEFGTSDTPSQPYMRPAVANAPGHVKSEIR